MAFSLVKDQFLRMLAEAPANLLVANVFEPALAIADATGDVDPEQRQRIGWTNWTVISGTLAKLKEVGYAPTADIKAVLDYFDGLYAKCRVDCITIPDVVSFLCQRADEIRTAAWAGWRAAAYGGSIPAPAPSPN